MMTATQAKTKIAHTPGPWTWRNVSGAGLQIYGTLSHFQPQDRQMVEFTMRGNVPVPLFCEMWMQFPSPAWDEMQEANARLIAAAPQLFEACKQALWHIGTDADRRAMNEKDRWQTGMDECADWLRAAIAKADAP